MFVEKLLNDAGLEAFGLEELATHGGSLRLYVRHQHATGQPDFGGRALNKVRQEEEKAGLNSMAPYHAFGQALIDRKYALLQFLAEIRREGKIIVGYGAPAKGNTLLNYCGHWCRNPALHHRHEPPKARHTTAWKKYSGV